MNIKARILLLLTIAFAVAVMWAYALQAQPFMGDQYDAARADQWSYGARNVYRWGPPAFAQYDPAPLMGPQPLLAEAPPLG